MSGCNHEVCTSLNSVRRKYWSRPSVYAASRWFVRHSVLHTSIVSDTTRWTDDGHPTFSSCLCLVGSGMSPKTYPSSKRLRSLFDASHALRCNPPPFPRAYQHHPLYTYSSTITYKVSEKVRRWKKAAAAARPAAAEIAVGLHQRSSSFRPHPPHHLFFHSNNHGILAHCRRAKPVAWSSHHQYLSRHDALSRILLDGLERDKERIAGRHGRPALFFTFWGARVCLTFPDPLSGRFAR